MPPSPTAAAPTPARGEPPAVQPTVDAILADGLELTADANGVFTLQANPGDRIRGELIITDDRDGTVYLGDHQIRYEAAERGQILLTYTIPIDITSPDLPLTIESSDGERRDYAVHLVVDNSTPVLVVPEITGLTNQPVSIDLTQSLDLDGDILVFTLKQEFNPQGTGNKGILEYITNTPVELASDGLGRFDFVTEWPGRYVFTAGAEDDDGNLSEIRIPVEVYWHEQPFEIRGVMIDGWVPHETASLTVTEFARLLDLLAGANINYVSLNPLWYLEGPESTDFIRGPQVWQPGAPTTSINDDQLADLIDLAHERGMSVLLKPMVFVSDWTWIGSIDPKNPQQWLDNYSQQVLLPMARLASEHDVEMLSLFNDPAEQNQYRSLWADIVGEVRRVYGGKITVADSSGFPSIYRTLHPMFDPELLDVYGFQAYLPGSGYPIYPHIPGDDDPTVQDMVSSISEHINAREREVLSTGLLAVATEMGVRPFDGANQDPANVAPVSEDARFDWQEQVEYFEANLRVLSSRPWMAGVFAWSVSLRPATDIAGGEHDLQASPAVMDLLRIWYYAP